MLKQALETNLNEVPLVDEDIKCRIIELETMITSEDYKVVGKILKEERMLLLKSLLLRKQAYQTMAISNSLIRESRMLRSMTR